MGSKTYIFRFADVEVREREFCLVKAGEVLPVEPKTFRVLLFLLRNPLKLISKEELVHSVWGDTAVADGSLTRCIWLLRRLLGDDIKEPRYIETVATVGYRWLCPVEVVEVSEKKPEAPQEKRMGRSLQKPLLAGTVLVAALLAGAVWYLQRPLPSPYISKYTQITHDGHSKLLGGTDGSRLYFEQESPNSIFQIGVSGGERVQIPVKIPSSVVWDVSPDGSSLLIASNQPANPSLVIWDVPVLGGSYRRLGEATNAAFSPDGKSVVYSTQQGDIYIVGSDGNGTHKLASLGPGIGYPKWSPDGHTLRFYKQPSIWEMSSTGSHLHPLLPGWNASGWTGWGNWTPDGKFFLFLAGNTPEGQQIWALDERRGLFRHPSRDPIQLTTGTVSWTAPIPSRDGKTIFAQGLTERGELSRFDPMTGQPQPFLGGLSAEFVAFSKDGKSVAYVSYPEGILWKANRDGSSPVQLTDSPLYAFLPNWSPDGAQILFTGISEGRFQAFVVAAEGGSPRMLLPNENGEQIDSTWSSDGSKIVFASGKYTDPKCDLRIFDLASHKVDTIPGSLGMFGPRWSPDGRYIAAHSMDGRNLRVFDIRTQRWSTLLENFRGGWLNWSGDSQFIYYLHIAEGDRNVSRIRATGGKPERILDLKDWHLIGRLTYSMAIDPTGAPLMLRDNGSDDIYALTLELR